MRRLAVVFAAVGALALAGCVSEADVNDACRDHGGVRMVNVKSSLRAWVVCEDGTAHKVES